MVLRERLGVGHSSVDAVGSNVRSNGALSGQRQRDADLGAHCRILSNGNRLGNNTVCILKCINKYQIERR